VSETEDNNCAEQNNNFVVVLYVTTNRLLLEGRALKEHNRKVVPHYIKHHDIKTHEEWR